mmetsp:Transcript_66435/g.111373  ORF Transcript_66435/g.111373 Transcript_66435/m.111373 type:complete len:335 (-) Transcript_66435:195-1199(-)
MVLIFSTPYFLATWSNFPKSMSRYRTKLEAGTMDAIVVKPTISAKETTAKGWTCPENEAIYSSTTSSARERAPGWVLSVACVSMRRARPSSCPASTRPGISFAKSPLRAMTAWVSVRCSRCRGDAWISSLALWRASLQATLLTPLSALFSESELSVSESALRGLFRLRGLLGIIAPLSEYARNNAKRLPAILSGNTLLMSLCARRCSRANFFFCAFRSLFSSWVSSTLIIRCLLCICDCLSTIRVVKKDITPGTTAFKKWKMNCHVAGKMTSWGVRRNVGGNNTSRRAPSTRPSAILKPMSTTMMAISRPALCRTEHPVIISTCGPKNAQLTTP